MKKHLLIILIFDLFLLILANNLDKLPGVLAANWCLVQSCTKIGSLTISQLSSSIIVFSFGFITVYLGLKLYSSSAEFNRWWGLAIILWGLGAIFAGISYQAFGYELKCQQELCNWTTWWEVYYMILTMASVTCMYIAQGILQENNWYIRSGLIIITLYSICILVGSIIPNRFLVSFEFLVILLVPLFLFLFINNYLRYKSDSSNCDLKMMKVWIALALVMIAYFGYFLLGITELLWNKGVWFTENDVLHILLANWMIIVYNTISTWQASK
ncbi:MAG: hypothetical protein INQ03_11295 [Candidatus Heimdallarchaeota archaeon]|nr:hypothetical protein [Candidatus Heimdallarchaeota archaeon]